VGQRRSGIATLEALTPGAAVRGLIPDALVTVVQTQWFDDNALELTYKTAAGKVANELLYRHDEPRLEIVELDPVPGPRRPHGHPERPRPDVHVGWVRGRVGGQPTSNRRRDHRGGER
jgi:hypothetical protein